MTIAGGWEIFWDCDHTCPVWCAIKGDVELQAVTKHELEQMMDQKDYDDKQYSQSRKG